MLVHIEREDRCAAGERVAMIRRPLINELAIARRPGQQHPARTAAKRFPHSDELRPPALIRAKIACKRIAQNRRWFALISKPVKKQLVQDHRVHRDELLALETVDKEAGSVGV